MRPLAVHQQRGYGPVLGVPRPTNERFLLDGSTVCADEIYGPPPSKIKRGCCLPSDSAVLMVHLLGIMLIGPQARFAFGVEGGAFQADIRGCPRSWYLDEPDRRRVFWQFPKFRPELAQDNVSTSEQAMVRKSSPFGAQLTFEFEGMKMRFQGNGR